MKINTNKHDKITFPMAIILGKGKRTQRLIKILSQSFDSIRIIESKKEIKRPFSWFSPQLVVVTDSFPGGVSHALLDYVKNRLTPDALICLADDICEHTEIRLRSSGLVFLGSFEMFFDYAEAIIDFSFNKKSVSASEENYKPDYDYNDNLNFSGNML